MFGEALRLLLLRTPKADEVIDPDPGSGQLVSRLESAQDPLELVPAGGRPGPFQPGLAEVEQRRQIGGVEMVPLVSLRENLLRMPPPAPVPLQPIEMVAGSPDRLADLLGRHVEDGGELP